MHSTHSTDTTHVLSSATPAAWGALVSVAGMVEQSLPHASPGFEQREETILRVTNELARRLLEADLQRVADSFGHEVTVEGRRYRRHEEGIVKVHTLCGPVMVRRASYRHVGVHNGPTIVPFEIEAGLIAGATPALAYSVGQGLAHVDSRALDSMMRGAHRDLPSRSTVERLGKVIGGCVKQDSLVLEALLRADEDLPDGANAISIGLDRTTTPMAEERPPDQAPTTPRKPRSGPYKRKRPHPIDVVYRMAYVGTVAVVDKGGEAIVTRKYAATAEEGPDELVRRVMADVVWLRRKRSLPVVVVQDGAPELWGLMWEALRAAGIKKWHQAIDRYHVTERIAAVLTEVVRDPELRSQTLAFWRRELERTNRAVEKFAEWAISTYFGKPAWQRIEGHQYYLEMAAISGRTNYRTLRNKGLPTASGVTEGACKSLIAARCKRSGQRWRQDGLTAILTLRAMVQSDRYERMWPLFARRFLAEVH